MKNSKLKEKTSLRIWENFEYGKLNKLGIIIIVLSAIFSFTCIGCFVFATKHNYLHMVGLIASLAIFSILAGWLGMYIGDKHNDEGI